MCISNPYWINNSFHFFLGDRICLDLGPIIGKEVIINFEIFCQVFRLFIIGVKTMKRFNFIVITENDIRFGLLKSLACTDDRSFTFNFNNAEFLLRVWILKFTWKLKFEIIWQIFTSWFLCVYFFIHIHMLFHPCHTRFKIWKLSLPYSFCGYQNHSVNFTT